LLSYAISAMCLQLPARQNVNQRAPASGSGALRYLPRGCDSAGVDVRRLAAIDMYGLFGTRRRRRVILAEFVFGAVVMVGAGAAIIAGPLDARHRGVRGVAGGVGPELRAVGRRMSCGRGWLAGGRRRKPESRLLPPFEGCTHMRHAGQGVGTAP
jgi:hypothetical protein